jgi:hypothetical protein
MESKPRGIEINWKLEIEVRPVPFVFWFSMFLVAVKVIGWI